MEKITRPERRRLEREVRKRLSAAKKSALADLFPRPKMLSDVVSSKEAARYLGVTVQRVSQLAKEKSLQRIGYGMIGAGSLIEYKKKYGGRRRRLGSQWGSK